MKIVEAIVKESKLIYPEKDNKGYLSGKPTYKTTVSFNDNNKPLEFSFYDEFAYFDVGSKIKVKYDGYNVKINEIQHEIPRQVNTLVNLGRKHPYIIISIFVATLLWIFIFGNMQSLLALLPFGILFVIAGIINFINYLNMKNVIIINGIIKDIIKKYSPSGNGHSNWQYYYVYEYQHNNKKILHTSFFNGAKKDKIGTGVDLIYNKDINVIMEKRKHKNLIINGILSIVIGIFFDIIIFIIK